MKYYIALSSLNIDNILSSESISPYSFYEKRDFGYRSFQKIKNVILNNDILLFSQLPYFTIQDSDSENYPMVIEIEDDNQLNKKIRKISSTQRKYDVFQCDESIYLNPWNCKILFFSQQAITLAKLKCEDSLCNKLGHLFRIELISQNKSTLLTDMLKDLSFQESPFNLEKFVVDSKINKIKGFLYAYYLGITKSLSQNTAQLLSIQKRIYNIVASIINNKGISNDRFNEELKVLDSQYNEIDPHKKELRQIWAEKVLSRFSSIDDKSAFELILKELSIESDAKMNFCRSHNILVRKMPFLLSNKNFDWITYQNELNSYTQNIIYEEKLNRHSVELEKEVSIKSEYNGVSLTSSDSKLYNEIITKFFFDNVTTIEDLRLKKLYISTEFTKEVKNILQSEHIDWESSRERVYLNSLRQNIANSEPFNLQQSPNLIIMSIAAFLLKGDDFDALSRYIEENGVPSYNFVLGLWGAACGYIDMPKPMFKPLISNKDKFCNIYKSVYYLLYKTNLPDTFPEVVTKQIKISTLKPVEKSHIIVPSIINEHQTQDTKIEIQNINPLTEELSIFVEYISKDKTFQKEIISKLNEIGIKSLVDWNDKAVDSIKWSTSKGQKKLMTAISKSRSIEKQKKQVKQTQDNSIFQFYQSSGFFLNDFDFISTNPDFIKNVASSKDWEKDLKWFIESHEKSHKDYEKYWKEKPTDNESIIKQFVFFRKEKYKDSEALLRQIYSVNER